MLKPGQPHGWCSFTGGLPHITMVVGEDLNLTAYDSRQEVDS